MKTHTFAQGGPEWHVHRASHFNASDAPAMLGCSPYKTRQQLLHELHTGYRPEADSATQRRFDDGHRYETLARPLAEKIIGEDLAPVVGTEGELSASFDGLTMLGDVAWEHKSLNDELRGCMTDQGNGYGLPKHYRVQMEQQLLVSGAERVLFMASKWDGDTLVEARHCWYASDPVLRAEIVAGWKQFAADLASYVPGDAPAPKLVAEPVEALPAPVVQVTGQIALQDNFKAFEQRLRAFLADRLIREPKTDQDFVDLDAQIKAMKQARESLKAAEAQMLAQVQPINQAKATKDMLDKLLQQSVSMAEKLLTAEKERRKGEIVAGGVAEFKVHMDALNTRLGKPYMPAIAADFGGVVRGLKSLSSMEDKVASELARAKIHANQVADGIDANLRFLREHATEYRALFADTAQLVLKPADDFQALVRGRIAEHQAAVQREADAAAERARAKIREEEQARAEKEARDKLAAEQAEAKRLVDEQAERDEKSRTEITPERGLQQVLKAEAATPDATDRSTPAIASPSVGSMGAGQPADAGPAGNVVPLTRPAAPPPAPDTPPSLTLGTIKERLAPALSTDAAGLAALGFEPAISKGSARTYHERDWPLMLAAMVAHMRTVQAKAAQPAAA